MVIHRRGASYSLLCLLILFFVSGPLMAASLDARLDKSSVEFGQSVNLTITATGLSGEIDLSVLESDFDVLDTSRSRSVRIINGQSDSSLVWQVALMPLKTGEIKIPAFTLDDVTSAESTLSVGEPRSGQQSGPTGEDFFLEISADKTEAFVQEQIIITARVYQARNIIEGSLSDPTGDGLLLQRLGNDQTFSATVKGRQYNVIERRYAIFAQESGDHTISPLRLEATVRSNNSSGGSGFFTPTQRVRVASNSLVLSVKPKPAESNSGWWLPAEALNITGNWEEDINNARVDEPITRTISIAAKGVSSTQLPPLDIPELNGAKVYPDQPNIQTQNDGDSLITYRTDKWAIIPRNAGPLIIPEVRIEWYDTINKKVEYAVLPEQVIEILPSENAGQDSAKSTAPVIEAESTDNEQVPQELAPDPMLTTAIAPVAAESSNWKSAFYVVLGLWLATLGAWFWFAQIKRRPRVIKPQRSQVKRTISFREIEAACGAGNPEQITQALLLFAKDKWQNDAPLSLGEFANRLQHAQLTEQLQALDKAVYGRAPANADYSSLLEALKAALKMSSEPAKKTPSAESHLPDL